MLFRSGQATDLGPLTIQSLGQSLQQQLALLANAKAQLESSETALEASRTPLQRLEQIGAAVDLDLSLAGPSLLSARTDLAARAHLWLNADDRDAVLTQQPVLLSFQGQLLAGDGQFSLSGLPLALLFLGRLIDGQPGLIIHPQCQMLRKGMGGGYAYRRVQVSGEERYRDVPDKNMYSHVCEAAQYMMLGGGEGRNLIRRDRPAIRQATAISEYAIM